MNTMEHDLTKLACKRAKTPTVLQMESVECGAAALAIIMEYYRKIVSLERLRADCGISRDGSKANNMLKIARKYGFKADGYKYEIDELHELTTPYIVFWNFNHYIVIEGFKKDFVYINDPATGPRKITFAEFDKSFTGIVLTLTPSSKFKPSGKKVSILSALKSQVKSNTRAMSYLFLVGMALVIPSLLLPIFSKIFIDSYFINQLDSWVPPLLLGMAITAVVRFILRYIQTYHLTRLRMKIAISMSGKFIWHLLKLPLVFFAQRATGDISNRISLNEDVADVLANDVTGSFLNLMMIIFFAALMFYYDAEITIIIIGVAAINIYLLKLVARIRKDKSQQLIAEESKKIGTAAHGLLSIESLKASSRETDFFAKWAGQQANAMNVYQTMTKNTLALTLIPYALNTFSTAIILTLGAIKIINGVITVGTLVALQSLMASFMAPIDDLTETVGNLQQLHGNLSKLKDVNQYEIAPRFRKKKPRKLPFANQKLAGHLHLDNLTFGYNRLDPPLIKDFSLQLKPGARVALVGRSGSGKSTLAKLIVGLYQPWKGSVYFDNIAFKDIPNYILVNSLSMVEQDCWLFAGTITDNITMMNKAIPEQDIIQAATDAQIHQSFVSRKHGYDATVEEYGRNFSGGERQRIDIARALAIKPSILVLDEATNSLDPITEMAIDDALRRRGCTTIIVAHRLSTIRDCDEIIVLDKGNVVQRGAHDKLIAETGFYKSLIKKQ